MREGSPSPGVMSMPDWAPEMTVSHRFRVAPSATMAGAMVWASMTVSRRSTVPPSAIDGRFVARVTDADAVAR